MVDYKYSDLFTKDSVDKQLVIKTDDGLVKITNTELHSEKFELTESLCSESELTFGCCEASSIKFTISNVFIPLKDKWLTVTETLDGNTDVSFQFGRYKVYSDTPTADRTCRNVVAYDAMYDIINADVAEWYNTILPNETSTVTLKAFRDSFFEHFGIEQEEVSLINDGMTIEKTVEVTASSESSSGTEETSTIGESMSGREVLSCICEINGCSGHIGRDGKFHYIYLEQEIQGLYPANDLYPADDLYPKEPKTTGISKGLYISADYEDFLVKTIDKLQIRETQNDIGVIVGTGSNSYIIEDNFLVYGKGTTELTEIANNIYEKIKGIVYRPFSADCKGNPCLEVGDAVRISTKYELIETYIFKRTLKGVQALRDSYESSGEEYRTEEVNSVQRSILQLKGKSNVLERSIEETKSTITDVEAGLQSEILQTAEQVKVTVAKTEDVWDTSDYDIEVISYGHPNTVVDSSGNKVYPASKYSGKYYLDQETGYLYLSDGSNWKKTKTLTKVSENLKASINVESDRITSLVSATIDGKNEASLKSQIEQTKDSITAEVTRAKREEETLSSRVEITEKGIKTKVSKDSVVSEINQSAEGIKIKADLLELKGSMQMTGGYVHIEASESTDNLIEFKRSGTKVQMGTDGMKAIADTRTAIFQYSQIGITNEASDGTVVAQLLDSGKGVSSYGWDSYSDKRLKHDIESLDIDDRADFIYSLEPCRFRYNYDAEEHWRHGLIAQDVQKAIGDEDWAICGKYTGADGEEYLTLDYPGLISDLIATIKSLNKRVAELEGKLNE